MADITIQRKKNAPSPWWLVLLAVLALAIGAYIFLRPDPVDEPAPAISDTVPTDTLSPDSPAAQARAMPPPADAAPGVAEPEAEAAAENTPATPEALAAQAATNPTAPDYARRGLQLLTTSLVDLADRPDLRDPAVLEQRDNLTSATSRLDTPNAPLRAGFVAAASLIRAMQQKAYPALESAATDLVQKANQLSGRNATAAEQQQNQQFLTAAAAAVQSLNQPSQN
jgi:hypothetical protein